ncbi:hypothetical protein [Cerasicoccus frondis]|uniref:hypothetical protein n=1 Tax=Cerasicoccus frondis TaxID=490090 RepID=UPI002852B6F7|nr:hypothetical protein [Cerasicoccus frondis]
MEFYQHRKIYQSDGIVESIAYELDADYRFLSFCSESSTHVDRFKLIETLDDWIGLIVSTDIDGYMANLNHAEKLIHLISAYRINLNSVEPTWVLDYSQISKGEEAITRGVIWLAKGIDDVAHLMKRYII